MIPDLEEFSDEDLSTFVSAMLQEEEVKRERKGGTSSIANFVERIIVSF